MLDDNGYTFCTDMSMLYRYAMTSITVPEPVMSLAIAPKSREASGAFSKALNRFTKEDPTFKVGLDGESGQTIISGMGELHLDIYVERMKREYKVWSAHFPMTVLTVKKLMQKVLEQFLMHCWQAAVNIWVLLVW